MFPDGIFLLVPWKWDFPISGRPKWNEIVSRSAPPDFLTSMSGHAVSLSASELYKSLHLNTWWDLWCCLWDEHALFRITSASHHTHLPAGLGNRPGELANHWKPSLNLKFQQGISRCLLKVSILREGFRSFVPLVGEKLYIKPQVETGSSRTSDDVLLVSVQGTRWSTCWCCMGTSHRCS